MLRTIAAAAAMASLIAVSAAAHAQTTYAPGATGTKSDREAGRVTTSDQDGGGSGPVTSGAAPDPAIGNNTSKGTDARGTVDPPTRDRDANDALKKKE